MTHLSPSWILFLVLVVVSTSVYVQGPIALREKHRVDTNRRTRTMTGADELRADPELLAYVVRTEGLLQQQGFGSPHRIVFSETATMFSFASLLEHAGEGDIATVMALRSTMNPKPQVIAAVTIMSAAGDGVRIVTSNVSAIKRFPTRPDYDSARFPALEDMGELYAVHRFRTSRRPRPASVGPRTRGATEGARIAFQDREAEGGYDFWVSRGYYYRTAAELRPTWKGAVCFTWRGLFPWRQLSEWRAERKAAAILRDFATAS